MQSTIQPFINYANANMALITRVSQSPELEELARANIEKYIEVAQQSFAEFAQSELFADLMRSSMENYSRFMTEMTRNAFSSLMEGQEFVTRRVEEVSQRVEQGMNASARTAEQMKEAVEEEANKTFQQRRQAR